MPLWVIPTLYVAGTIVFSIGFVRFEMLSWQGKLSCCVGFSLSRRVSLAILAAIIFCRAALWRGVLSLSSASLIAQRSSDLSTGLPRKSVAPAFMASTLS